MKPKNNKPFCPDCGRPKMLFETEKKAQNFIKYNGNDILKEGQTIDQIRVYYCPSCCGYHITTKPFKEGYNYRTENLIKAYERKKAYDKTKFNTNKIGISTDEINDVANEIIKRINKASVTDKKQIKQIIKKYFDIHTQYNQVQEDKIRHQINQMLK